MIRWCALLGCCCAALIAADANPVLARATAERTAAETELAQLRERLLGERAALAAQVQEAQAALSERRLARQQELQAVQNAEAELLVARRDASEVQQRQQRLLGQLARAAGMSDREALAEGAIEAGVEQRLQALDRACALQWSDEPVRDRRGQSRTAPVLRFGAVQALALGHEADSQGWLLPSGDGPPLIVGERFTPTTQADLKAAQSGRPGLLPVDVGLSQARLDLPEPWSLVGWLRAGGPFVWPIIAVALAGLAIACERIIALWLLRAPPSLAGRVLTRLREADAASALSLVADRRTPMARLLAAGLEAWSNNREGRESAMETAYLAEELRLQRGLRLLAVLAGLAPLLGLLGTVSGMIGTFDAIAIHGAGDARQLSGGIAQALITTQLGLMVAVPILLGHALISRAVERRSIRLEQAAGVLLGEAAT